MPIEPGSSLGHYEILSSLGVGGMGEVYRARDGKLGREVAIKLLLKELSSDARRLARFEREARILASLNHNNIATLHAFETEGDTSFLVMELVEGGTLADRIRRGATPIQEALPLCLQIAEGLQAAHDHGVIHRDLKPANIKVTKDGAVKILDFGLAKAMTHEGAGGEPANAPTLSALTEHGLVLGTAAYMSPEQARGQVVDKRADIWAFGCLLFEMLTAHRAFTGETVADCLSAVLSKDPDWERLPETTPRSIRRVLSRCLVKDPAARLRDIGDARLEIAEAFSMLAAAEGAGLPGTGVEEPPSSPVPASRDGRRSTWLIIAIGILVAAVGIATWMMLGGDSPPPPVLEEATADSLRTLAVLPFVNLRPSEETDFLGYALADRVINQLGYSKELVVRPSSAVRQYDGRAVDPAEVAAQLDVRYLLTASYLKEGDALRLQVELVDVEANAPVWQLPIDITFENAFALQDLVTEHVTDGLRVQFTDAERYRAVRDVPSDPLAYEYYLHAISYPTTVEGINLAIEMLQRALELDPEYAPAWGRLANSYHLKGNYVGGADWMERAERAARRGQELNPESLEVIYALLTILVDSGHTEEAAEQALRGLAINPNGVAARAGLAYAYRYAGLLEESAAEFERVIELEPRGTRARSLGITYYNMGRFEEAIEVLGRIDAASPFSRANTAIALQRMGRVPEALEVIEQILAVEPEGFFSWLMQGVRAAEVGPRREGLEAAQMAEAADIQDGEALHHIGLLYCQLDEAEGCVRMLEAAYDRGYFNYPYMRDDPYLDLVRDEPTFQKHLVRVHQRHLAFRDWLASRETRPVA